jgi:hypothetical protein
MDLRERVLDDSDAVMMADAVAEKYRVSGSWVRLLKQRRRETGEVAPRSPLGGMGRVPMRVGLDRPWPGNKVRVRGEMQKIDVARKRVAS